MYNKNGLADDVFMLGATNALVAPILKYLDFGYIFSRFSAWRQNKPGTVYVYL